ncbi:MAG: hypothetical protein JWP89_1590 [Schlesneria sp.]|nr:hypothetical protein [Schlesneria sp.]
MTRPMNRFGERRRSVIVSLSHDANLVPEKDSARYVPISGLR